MQGAKKGKTCKYCGNGAEACRCYAPAKTGERRAFTIWTDANLLVLKNLWAAGYSAGDIAGRLGQGITRSAVLGKLHRLGMQRKKKA